MPCDHNRETNFTKLDSEKYSCKDCTNIFRKDTNGIFHEIYMQKCDHDDRRKLEPLPNDSFTDIFMYRCKECSQVVLKHLFEL